MNKIFNRLLEDLLRKQCFGKLGSVQSCHYVFMHYHFVKYSYFDSNLTEISSGGFNLSWKIHSIGSGNNTLLPEPMVTQFIDAFLHHHASLTWYLGNWFDNCCHILWICCERSFSEFYLFIWNRLVFNQGIQLFVQSPQPSLLIFAWRNEMCFPTYWAKTNECLNSAEPIPRGIEMLINFLC